ncbi:MAG: sulfite exporter TauE/SafE family protein [Ferruginibacter sp.]|nr:sulfite exporter TauE/SafE family protein [Ferruginibacter sp.]
MQKPKKMDIQFIISLLLIGLAAGTLGGLVGVGGGIIIVPALIYIVGFSQFQAQGTSLALIMFPVGILAVIQYYKKGYINFNYVALLAVGFVIGGYLGSKLTLSLRQDTVKKVFAILMLIIAIKMLFLDKPKNNNTEKEQATQNH